MEKSIAIVHDAAEMVEPNCDKLDFVQENQVILATPKQFDLMTLRENEA